MYKPKRSIGTQSKPGQIKPPTGRVFKAFFNLAGLSKLELLISLVDQDIPKRLIVIVKLSGHFVPWYLVNSFHGQFVPSYSQILSQNTQIN